MAMHKSPRHLRSRYGITEDQYQRLYESQNGLCAGCGNPPRPGGLYNVNATLFLDHNHYTDEIRGLLCQQCNAAVGLAYDNPRTLRLLAEYLEREPAISLDEIVPMDKGRRMRDRTRCKNGHEYTPENTKMRTWNDRRNPGRVCKTCEKHWETKRKRNLLTRVTEIS